MQCRDANKIMSSTYTSFVTGQQTNMEKNIIEKEHTENYSGGTNHTSKMENENGFWKMACWSLQY